MKESRDSLVSTQAVHRTSAVQSTHWRSTLIPAGMYSIFISLPFVRGEAPSRSDWGVKPCFRRNCHILSGQCNRLTLLRIYTRLCICCLSSLGSWYPSEAQVACAVDTASSGLDARGEVIYMSTPRSGAHLTIVYDCDCVELAVACAAWFCKR
jgi:hypothetical protein